MPDPYYVAVRLFAALVDIAGRHLDQAAPELRLAEIAAKLDELAAQMAMQDT